MARSAMLEQHNSTNHHHRHPLGSAIDPEDGRVTQDADDATLMSALSYAPIVTLVLALICYSLGIDSVTRVILGEIFPTEIRYRWPQFVHELIRTSQHRSLDYFLFLKEISALNNNIILILYLVKITLSINAPPFV